MSWTYGIIKHGDEDFRVHEIYFEEKGVWSYTTKAIKITGDDKTDILKMLKAITHDVKRNPIWIKEDLDKSLAPAPWEDEEDENG